MHSIKYKSFVFSCFTSPLPTVKYINTFFIVSSALLDDAETKIMAGKCVFCYNVVKISSGNSCNNERFRHIDSIVKSYEEEEGEYTNKNPALLFNSFRVCLVFAQI